MCLWKQKMYEAIGSVRSCGWISKASYVILIGTAYKTKPLMLQILQDIQNTEEKEHKTSIASQQNEYHSPSWMMEAQPTIILYIIRIIIRLNFEEMYPKTNVAEYFVHPLARLAGY